MQIKPSIGITLGSLTGDIGRHNGGDREISISKIFTRNIFEWFYVIAWADQVIKAYLVLAELGEVSVCCLSQQTHGVEYCLVL